MAKVDEQAVLKTLAGVKDDERGGDLVSLGMVSGLAIKDGHVAFAIEVAPERGPRAEPLRKAAEKAVFAMPGVLSVTAVLTAQTAGKTGAPPRRRGTGGTAMRTGLDTRTAPAPDLAGGAPPICARKSR